MLEPARALAWVVATLRASSAFLAATPGGVHEGVAPPGTAYPHCTVSMQSPGADRMGVAGYRLFATPLIAVQVWGLAENGWSALVTAADTADALLHQARHASAGVGTPDATVISSLREQPIMRTVVEDGIAYSVLGGLYRQQVRSNS